MRNFSLKFLFVLLLVSVAAWAIWARFEYPRTGIDDANIFFVYAQNAANGHGLVYNVGGEKVEADRRPAQAYLLHQGNGQSLPGSCRDAGAPRRYRALGLFAAGNPKHPEEDVTDEQAFHWIVEHLRQNGFDVSTLEGLTPWMQ